ncbi:hypothetical protein ACSVDA_19935 [Cytobacillus sp. Hm23]
MKFKLTKKDIQLQQEFESGYAHLLRSIYQKIKTIENNIGVLAIDDIREQLRAAEISYYVINDTLTYTMLDSKEISSLNKDIKDKILEIMTKYTVNEQRVKILDQMRKALKLDKQKKIDNVRWLYTELNLIQLDGINEQQESDKEYYSNAMIYPSHIKTFEKFIENARYGRVDVAYLELINFVDNSRMDITDPISNFEKVIIKIMCEMLFEYSDDEAVFKNGLLVETSRSKKNS